MNTQQYKNIHTDKILIVDFGSQYTQLIARRIRELGIYCEIFSCTCDAKEIQNYRPKGIILSGGPESVIQDKSLTVPKIIFELNVPVLGICYGMQAMATQLGGKVEPAKQREFGYAQIKIVGNSKLLTDIGDYNISSDFNLLDVWMSHGDKVVELPIGFSIIASSQYSPIAGIANVTKDFYGLQFHPEVTHTKQGDKILQRFAVDICACDTLWVTSNIITESLQSIRNLVGNDRVILGLSGGVDSAVVAVLLNKAIGDQLSCVFVDTGLLRLNEASQVMETFSKHIGMHVIHINAEQHYLTALAGIEDPEEKRKIIGALFVQIFTAEAAKLNNAMWLAQGTIYPDVIESAEAKNSKAQLIKSHHNVGGLPKNMTLKILEPLRELFKDEVRKIGLELGLPTTIVFRHPFPGPGFGIRILGSIKKEFVDLLRQAEAVFIEELHKHNLYDKVSQAFAVFLPVKSVGVMGDTRNYAYVISLRAVETTDFMTASWAHLPYDFLDLVSRRIINEVKGISRVTYDISGKPPATIEWE